MTRQNRTRPSTRAIAWLALAVVGLLVAASTAWGAPSISRASGTGPFWNAGSPTPSYVITGDDGEVIDWAVTGAGTAGGVIIGTGPVTLSEFPDGAGTLTASSLLGSDSVNFTRDTVGPVIAPIDFVAPAGQPLAGWYRTLTVTPTCSDATSGVATCPAVPWSITGPAPQVATLNATDNAGNASAASSAPFSFDAIPPATAGAPSEPGPAALVADEPLFKWTPGTDADSLVARYELQFQNTEDETPAFETIARVADTGGPGDYGARRDPALRAAPLPERATLEWRVRTFDTAGNVRSSTPARRLTIDSTIPPAPSITGGPLGPTRITSPSFSWNGTEELYLWDVTRAGTENAIRSGGGPEKQTTLSSLPDGDYTFRVKQVTVAGRQSAEATRAFKIDTVAPAPPVITQRPPFPSSGTANFAWLVEPGAYSHYQVVGTGGATVMGPSDLAQPNVSIPQLPAGAYSFRVLQVDPAGNVSAATVEAFTVVLPVLPPGPGAAGNVAQVLPKQFATRLRPRAGAMLATRRPVLRWAKGPRGTTLYNLQIFQVSKTKAKRKLGAPVVKKVHSAFPKGRQYRPPKSKMLPGTCYVWRVWPYLGRQFTAKPLGISNFCVASKKVLIKKAAAGARRKAGSAR